MAVFSKSYAAYFDCSGSPADGQAKVLVVSGAVSTLDKWLKFEREWTAILDKYGLPKPFHMAEFMNAWGGRPVERDEIVGALAKVIRKRTNKIFQSGVVLDDWRKVNEQYQLAEQLYYPFPLCGLHAVARLDRWKQRNDVQEPIERVFEDGDLHRDEFIELMEHITGAPIPIFKRKHELVPFQIGDFIAWQSAKTIGRVTTGAIDRPDQIPEPYWKLIRQENKDWGLWEEPSLIAECKKLGIPKR